MIEPVMLINARFTSVFPKRTVMNSLRGSSKNLITVERFLPSSARILSIWIRLKADRAVSDPEKNAERKSKTLRPRKL
jgi:hypothetical protein